MTSAKKGLTIKNDLPSAMERARIQVRVTGSIPATSQFVIL